MRWLVTLNIYPPGAGQGKEAGVVNVGWVVEARAAHRAAQVVEAVEVVGVLAGNRRAVETFLWRRRWRAPRRAWCVIRGQLHVTTPDPRSPGGQSCLPDLQVGTGREGGRWVSQSVQGVSKQANNAIYFCTDYGKFICSL